MANEDTEQRRFFVTKWSWNEKTEAENAAVYVAIYLATAQVKKSNLPLQRSRLN